AGIPDFLSGPVEVVVAHPHQRTVFERLEKGHTLAVTVRNSTGRTVKDLLLDVDTGLERIQKKLGDFGEETRTVSVPLRCDGKAGAYALTATVTGNLGDRRAEWRGTLNWHLVNRLPTFMPVAMWGGASFEQMEQCGFTHSLQWMDHVDMQAWKAGEPLGFIPRFDETRTMLNETLLRGLRVLGKMSPGGYFKHQKAYAKHRQPHLCQDVHGKPIEKAVDFAQPRVQQWGYDVGRSIFNNVGMFPAVDLFLTDSEFRDSGRVSYRPEIRAAFKKHAGYDIPKLVRAKTGVRHKEIPNFPRDRIVPDDDRILTFYRWFWGGGDGYPGMISRERDGVKGDREDLHPFWDPAVRCPSKWGSGGRTDIISQWTYVYPDPLVMGMATDELFAMVKGGPEYQKVMKMTQVIWYRSGTTGPLPKDKSKWTEWEKRLPDTKFITIPPDMLEIALWQKIARPIRGIQYHGSGSLWPSKPGGYDYTNSETAPRLAKLTSTIIKPLGPMLLAVPDRPAKVAMLESFTSQMFYGGATSGSMRGPVGRMHAVLYRAHLQPEIVYDETIQRDGLDPFDVLVAPYCGVLCESVARKIEVWQSRGGVLVADEDLTPRLMPDILIEKCGSSEKSELVEKARALRAELETVYTPHGDADTPDAILRFRKYGSTDYLFALNDRRTYGTYVGQYRRVMEKGQPLDATLTVRRPRGVVYDLVAHKRVEAQAVSGALQIAASFGPGEGRLFMITDHAIDKVSVTAPGRVARSKRATVEITVA
ncbi:MAG: hypothetical protein KAI66_04400, partial [Lentisphaeria bacterium]|nr:hypothetical protein [Lentisphaeria bacterium]